MRKYLKNIILFISLICYVEGNLNASPSIASLQSKVSITFEWLVDEDINAWHTTCPTYSSYSRPTFNYVTIEAEGGGSAMLYYGGSATIDVAPFTKLKITMPEILDLNAFNGGWLGGISNLFDSISSNSCGGYELVSVPGEGEETYQSNVPYSTVVVVRLVPIETDLEEEEEEEEGGAAPLGATFGAQGGTMMSSCGSCGLGGTAPMIGPDSINSFATEARSTQVDLIMPLGLSKDRKHFAGVVQFLINLSMNSPRFRILVPQHNHADAKKITVPFDTNTMFGVVQMIKQVVAPDIVVNFPTLTPDLTQPTGLPGTDEAQAIIDMYLPSQVTNSNVIGNVLRTFSGQPYIRHRFTRGVASDGFHFVNHTIIMGDQVNTETVWTKDQELRDTSSRLIGYLREIRTLDQMMRLSLMEETYTFDYTNSRRSRQWKRTLCRPDSMGHQVPVNCHEEFQSGWLYYHDFTQTNWEKDGFAANAPLRDVAYPFAIVAGASPGSRPDQATITRTYHPFEMIDYEWEAPSGGVLTFSLPSRGSGRLEKEIRPDGSWTSYQYNPLSGAVIEEAHEDGSKTVFSYTGVGLVSNGKLSKKTFWKNGQAVLETVFLPAAFDGSLSSGEPYEEHYTIWGTQSVIADVEIDRNPSGAGILGLRYSVTSGGWPPKKFESTSDSPMVTASWNTYASGIYTDVKQTYRFTPPTVTRNATDDSYAFNMSGSKLERVPGKSSRTEEISDYDYAYGLILKSKSEFVSVGTDWVKASETIYNYNTNKINKLVSITVDGVTIPELPGPIINGLTTTTVDADGVKTRTRTDASGEVVESIRMGVKSPLPGSDIPRDSVVTTIEQVPLAVPYHGMRTITKVTTPELEQNGVQISWEDANSLGRIYSSRDTMGRIHSTSVSDVSKATGEVRTTQLRPDGGMTLTTEKPGFYIYKVITGPAFLTTVTTFENYQMESELPSIGLPIASSTRISRGANAFSAPADSGSYQDGLGRTVADWQALVGRTGRRYRLYFHDSQGRLKKTATRIAKGNSLEPDPGAPDELIEYAKVGFESETGFPVVRGIDVNGNGVIDLTGTDHAVVSRWAYEMDGTSPVKVTRTRTYYKDNTADYHETETKESLSKASRMVKTTQSGGAAQVITTTQTDRATRTVTTSRVYKGPGLTAYTEIDVAKDGLLISRGKRVAAGGVTIREPNTFEYDSLRRLVAEFGPDGRQLYRLELRADGSVSKRFTGPSDAGVSESYAESSSAQSPQIITKTDARGATVITAYDYQGRVTSISGTGTYPIVYEYDDRGRMVKMKTWRDPQGGADETSWTYDAATDLLLEKKDAAGHAITYTYNDLGQLATRTDARGVITDYLYGKLGGLTSASYSDGTPDVVTTYDRAGRVLTTSDLAGVHTFAHSVDGMTSDQVTGGLLAGVLIEYRQSGYGGVALTYQNQKIAEMTYERNNAHGQMTRVGLIGPKADVAVTYGYHPGTDQVESSTVGAVTTTRTRDALGRTQTLIAKRGTQVQSVRAYAYDKAGRRVKMHSGTQDQWVYGYNDRGEVTSASRRRGGQALAGLSTTYAYDSLGNRTGTAIDLAADLETSFTTNAVNQYTSISHGDRVLFYGQADEGALLEQQTTAAGGGTTWTGIPRQGKWYASTQSGDNGTGPDWLDTSVRVGLPGTAGSSGLSAIYAGHQYLAPAQESLQYDLAGNLVSDGRWDYQWDAENRLVRQETRASARLAGVPHIRLEYGYDFLGRRIARKRTLNPGQPVAPVEEQRYVWSGWTLLAELTTRDAVTGSLLSTSKVSRTYLWGLDIASSLGGTGGTGALAAIVDYRHLDGAGNPVVLACSYDGNGNLVLLSEAGSGALLARYEYDAFGQQVMAETTPALTAAAHVRAAVQDQDWGFSTKQRESDSGLVYYGFRYYSPELGRWPNRDPIGERGGINLYGMCYNNPVSFVDFLGRDPITAGIYDGADQGGNGRANGGNFEQAAKRRSQIQVNAQDLTTAVSKLKAELEKKKAEYEQWANQVQSQGMSPSQFGRTPPTLTKVIIFDHGMEGSQELGSQEIGVFNQAFQDLSSMIAEEGTIEFAGCECGKGTTGQGYLESASVMSNRRIIGYKVIRYYGGNESTSTTDTTIVKPADVNRQNTSGFWPKVLDAYKQAFEQSQGRTCPLKDPKTGKIPAHLENR